MESNSSKDWVRLANDASTKKSGRQTFFSYFARRIHSRHSLYMISGFSQVILGISVIVSAILGLIRPLWISVLLTMAASLTVITGSMTIFMSLSNLHNSKSILQKAMKRVMKSKN